MKLRPSLLFGASICIQWAMILTFYPHKRVHAALALQAWSTRSTKKSTTKRETCFIGRPTALIEMKCHSPNLSLLHPRKYHPILPIKPSNPSPLKPIPPIPPNPPHLPHPSPNPPPPFPRPPSQNPPLQPQPPTPDSYTNSPYPYCHSPLPQSSHQ